MENGKPFQEKGRYLTKTRLSCIAVDNLFRIKKTLARLLKVIIRKNKIHKTLKTFYSKTKHETQALVL